MKPKWMFCFLSVAVFCCFRPAVWAQEEDRALRLALGDPRFKDRTVAVKPGEVVAAVSGRSVSPENVYRDLCRADFVYVGETHNSLPMHEIQLDVLKALAACRDRTLVLGLEMFPASSRDVLERWTAGGLSEEEFLRQARWYETWNFNWGYYRDLFLASRERSIPIVGLNVARELITKIRMRGWDGLSEEEQAVVPKPDLSHADHRELMKVIFSAGEMPPQMRGEGFETVFEGLYRAQSAWDEVMARHAALASEQGKTRVLVLAGSGHLLYNLGINRRVFERNGRPFRTIVCVTVPRGKPSVVVSRSLADYIWGIEEEERPAYPSVGLRFKTFEGLSNLVVDAKPVDGVALGQDFEKGDVVLSVDDKPFSDVNELRMHLARFRWGDESKFRLLRAGQEKTVVLKFVPPDALSDVKR